MTEGPDLAPGQEAGQTPPSFWTCPAQNDGEVCARPTPYGPGRPLRHFWS
eukprot:NODE_1474_length_1405_cov_19.213127_g1223_i0.p8 GENE.NODE_1474_length_1405_cov_19.213127_g1223_i0~~NODE_1474_length_1405_cov_19.213127_g1223_i0.p8  ORF type:complete len:50 (-),score=1.53 NODE_1474_length_1405_cov_19.213127_g1223_i0:327-476(-)